jgi:hypothetical protein
MQNLIAAGGNNGVVPSIQGTSYICKDCYHCHSRTSPSQQQQQQASQQQKLGHPLQLQEQAFRCSECQVKFESSTALETHLVSVHRKTYQCIKCQVKKDIPLKIVNTILQNTNISTQFSLYLSVVYIVK